MKLTVPKNAVRKSNVFYVSSEAEPTKTYMVVKAYGMFFCQCNDFFGRKLASVPKYAIQGHDHCKHTKFVEDVETTAPANVRVTSAVRG